MTGELTALPTDRFSPNIGHTRQCELSGHFRTDFLPEFAKKMRTDSSAEQLRREPVVLTLSRCHMHRILAGIPG